MGQSAHRFERRETRDDAQWPKTFAYRDVSGWQLVAVYFGLTFALAALSFVQAATYGLDAFIARYSAMWNGMSWLERGGFVLIQLMLFGALPLTILASYPATVTRRRWLDKSVEATPETLTFREADGQTTVRFDEITDYFLELLPGHFQDDLCVVEVGKRRFEFLSGIADSQLLRALVGERAVNANAKSWRHAAGRDGDILGGEQSLWRGANIGVGAKIHHYRTRFNRIALVFGLALTLMMWVRPLFGGVRGGALVMPQTEDWVMALIFSVLIGLPTLWGWLGWFFSAVERDESGLKQRGIWGRRELRWDEIEAWGYNGFCYFVRGAGTTLRYGIVADWAGLQAELQKRAPGRNAATSP